MKTASIAICIIFTLKLFSQTKEEKSFLSYFIETDKKQNQVYTDRIWPSNLELVKRALDGDKLIKKDRYRAEESLPAEIKLDIKETSFAFNEIAQADEQRWIKGKLKKLEFISLDSINQERKEGIHRTRFYSLSKPIFLKNETICLFYHDNAEYGELSVYIKKDKKWHYYSSLFNWIG